MSIWATQWDAEFPNRTKYGEVVPGDDVQSIYVCTSGMSTALRLSIDEGKSSTVCYLSPNEARQVAAALESAAQATEAAT